MKNCFYRVRPLWKRVYVYPIYVLPVLIRLTNSFHVVPLFTILFAIFLSLLTCWSDKIKILFTADLSNKPTHILFNGKLCLISKNTFIFNRSKYLIEQGNIIQLVPDTKKRFKFYKSEYKTHSYVEDRFLQHWPKNYFSIESPTFIKMFSQHATTPFFVFQVFCGILWCLDEYVYQALFTLIMLVAVEAGLVFQRIIIMKQFKTMNHKTVKIDLSTEKGIKQIDSYDIIPGNIIRIKSCIKVPCDLLLLRGACAVNEAILTGESVPLTKEDIVEVEDQRIFDFEKDKKHVLFAGTEIIKLDNNVIECFVLNTGFDTVQGKLIKKMMCNEEITVNDIEAFGFIGMLLVFALVAAIYTCKEGLKMGKSGYKVFLECILIITNVVPTELPLELSMAVNSCVSALKELGIFCLEPFRIPYAGKVNVCCFDKTGTLTETALDVSQIKFTTPFTADVLRTCNTLINLDNKITGDPQEVAIYEYMNKIVLKSNNITLSEDFDVLDKLFIDTTNKTFQYKYTIKKKFLFSSELKRMTVVYECNKETYVSMKGAPEVIKNYLVTVPDCYDDYEDYAKNGYRVIALAHKPFKKRTPFNRAEVEENLHFAGFILFDCKIKEHAKETISDLQNSGHKVVMITGDNILTALAVARKLGIINSDDDKVGVEGKDIDKVLSLDIFEQYKVFARADPEHKEKILERYNKKGYFTLMCGDGTNDVGALKSAHIGVALVEAQISTKPKIVIKEHSTPKQVLLQKIAGEMNDQTQIKMGDASVAAPFTAKTKSLECILNVIRQGRSALVTTIQMYKILALNSLVNAFSLSVLDCMGIRYGEYQLVVSGLLVALAFTFLSKNVPLKEISKKRPLTTIFSKYMMLSIFLQVIVHIFSYLIVLKRLKCVETIVYEEKFKPSVTNTALFLLSTSQQISTFLVNYIGRPFRESLVENRKLMGCLCLLYGIIFYILFDVNEEFSSMMEVISLGSLKSFLLFVIITDLGVCFFIEKICFRLFMI